MQTRILGNLLRISRCFDTYRRQNLKEIDLYPALHTVVSFVCRNPGCIQEDLVRRLCLDKTTVAHHLLKLEEKGFIERRVSEEDARCRLVYPTEKAMQIFPQMHAAYESYYEALLEGLTEEEKEAVRILSEKMFQNASSLVRR